MNLNYEHIKKFKKDGFLVYKNLINFKFCEKVNNIVYEYSRKDKISNELDLNFPFSKMDKNQKVVFFNKIPNHDSMNKLINFNKILKIGEFLTQKKLKIWFKKFRNLCRQRVLKKTFWTMSFLVSKIKGWSDSQVIVSSNS